MHVKNWDDYKERLRFKYGPRLATALINLSTLQTRLKLKGKKPVRVLVDNSVLQHGITHETAWVSTGEKKWGDIDVPTGYSARIPVHAHDDNSVDYGNVQYLPGIAYLAKRGQLELKTSGELQNERLSKPSGMFSGYGYSDFNVFRDVPMESIGELAFPTMGPSSWGLPSAAEQQRERLSQSTDARYQALVKQLGQKNSQDAWHIRTAEIHACFCFLTMDYRLIRNLYSARLAEPTKSLQTRVMTPQQFGQHWGLLPVPPRILSYNNPVFGVRADLNMPESRRRPKRRYSKSSN
ncbi:hypothetical protein [Phyllobacterium sp. 22552]|uniref:hypothetical protein n=1 Tax=Phyllobacterium sp. 22552 TaxID=3453941 RepID=UPI003F85EF60